jgi:actin-related protein
VREIKEKLCYTVNNYDDAINEAEESHACDKSYEMPDGKKIVLANERFKVAEAIFNPTLAGLEMEGL